MATAKQRKAARKNIRKAQQAWKGMSRRQHSRAQPQGRARKRPGTGGSGKFFRIEVRPKSEFVSFRNHDVGESGHLERLSGRRQSGSWATASWLVSKEDAHKEGDRLVIDNPKVREALRQLRGEVTHVRGDIFSAKPRRNVPEASKPTPAERRARKANIEKAQRARRRAS
jgi:hypothetical protein